MSGGRLIKNNTDDEFALRTVMAMASDMVEVRAKMNSVFVQFEALAALMGVKVLWDNYPGA